MLAVLICGWGTVYSRDIEGSVGPEVGGCDAESLVDLVLTGGTVVLDVAVLGLDVIGVEIGDCGDVGVGNKAVVALVVVVGENLPVEVSLHVPGVVEVVLIEVVELESGLLVDTFEVVLPGDLWCFTSVHVDPHKAIEVDVGMGGEEVTSMEGTDVSLHIAGDEEFIAGSVILDTVAGVGDAGLVGGKKPLASEDRTLLQLVHGLGSVPGSRKSSDGSLSLLCWGGLWGRGSGAEVIPQEGHCDGFKDKSS